MGSALIGIAALLALALALLAVPVTVAFRIDRTGKVEGQVRVMWLFGLVRFRADVPGTGGPGRRRRAKGEGTSPKRKAGGNARAVLSLLKRSSFRRHVAGFARAAIRSIHARDLYFRARVGLGDPADTGRLWALLGPAAGFLAALHGADIRIEPEFVDPVLELESRGEVRIVPLRLLALAAAFAASAVTLRGWYAWRPGSA